MGGNSSSACGKYEHYYDYVLVRSWFHIVHVFYKAASIGCDKINATKHW